MKSHRFENEISIVVSGEAGQGLQKLETLLTHLAKMSGFHVFAYSEFMSRIRGGNNSTAIRVASKRISAFVDRIDIFIAIAENAAIRFHDRISRDTFIIGDTDYIDKKYKSPDYNVIDISFKDMADQAGGELFKNIVIIGFLTSLLGIDFNLVQKIIKREFQSKDESIIKKNIAAAKAGYSAAGDKTVAERLSVKIKPSKDAKGDMLLYGNEAVGIGALAGGCNFVSSYPMSPSTGVLVFLAEKSEEFRIIVEQAEDEISAINMILGAWYAGARAFVTTSGGGFALMTEGLSLAGAIESPAVIHIGQRPGPATGLPTRTEQGDLLMAIHSGHGEFPRAVFAPGTFRQAVELTSRAFNLADKYQVPVFILTDQFFLDSACDIESIDISGLKPEKHFIRTGSKYSRYELTSNGVSPRGIPGYGTGIVCVDSDEHDVKGNITEDFDVRNSMVEKRLRKFRGLTDEAVPPVLTGSKKYKYLIVGWGSTYGAIAEALDLIQNRDIAFLHFSQVYPVHKSTKRFLEKAEKRIIIENNATSQFGSILYQKTGLDFDARILKYNGMPFSVEEIIKGITSNL